jgi:hypothetical protein
MLMLMMGLEVISRQHYPLRRISFEQQSVLENRIGGTSDEQHFRLFFDGLENLNRGLLRSDILATLTVSSSSSSSSTM